MQHSCNCCSRCSRERVQGRFPLACGDAVEIFSESAGGRWVQAEVVALREDSRVRAHYKIGHYWHAKTLSVHSRQLRLLPVGLDECSEAASISSERDPGAPMANPIVVRQPLMQGCRSALPMDPTKYYLELDRILQMLRNGDVVLVKGSWLLECYKERRVLPRRQQLPPEATWNVTELESVLVNEQAAIVSISHCWYYKHHPDPNGHQVQEVGPILEACLKYYKTSPTLRKYEKFGLKKLADNHRQFLSATPNGVLKINFDLAIFWCWCSFYQEPRTEAEQQAFERSMGDMDLWYTNRNARVWMLKKVPTTVENNKAYEDRGWTTWEKQVAMLGSTASKDLADTGRLLDLSKLEGKEHLLAEGFTNVESVCSLKNCSVHLDPAEFAQLIETKHFTKGRPDLERVKENYKRNFDQVMSALPDFYEARGDFQNVLTSINPKAKQLINKMYRPIDNFNEAMSEAFDNADKLTALVRGNLMGALDSSNADDRISCLNSLNRYFGMADRDTRAVIRDVPRPTMDELAAKVEKKLKDSDPEVREAARLALDEILVWRDDGGYETGSGSDESWYED